MKALVGNWKESTKIKLLYVGGEEGDKWRMRFGRAMNFGTVLGTVTD